MVVRQERSSTAGLGWYEYSINPQTLVRCLAKSVSGSAVIARCILTKTLAPSWGCSIVHRFGPQKRTRLDLHPAPASSNWFLFLTKLQSSRSSCKVPTSSKLYWRRATVYSWTASTILIDSTLVLIRLEHPHPNRFTRAHGEYRCDLSRMERKHCIQLSAGACDLKTDSNAHRRLT